MKGRSAAPDKKSGSKNPREFGLDIQAENHVAKRAQIIPPRPDLKRKAVNFSKGFDLKLAPNVVKQLEKVVHDSRDKFTGDIAQRLETMRTALDADANVPENHPMLIRLISDGSREIKGAGGTVGFDLLTHIGKSLNDLVTDLETLSKRHVDICGLHIDAMYVVLANRITGSGGEIEAELVNAFNEAREKFKLADHEDAQSG